MQRYCQGSALMEDEAYPSCMDRAVLATAHKEPEPSSVVFLVSPRGPEPCIPGLPPNSFH